MSLQPKSITFAQIAKHPLVYALIIIGGLLGSVVFYAITESRTYRDRTDAACEKEKETWRALYINERGKSDALNRELLIRNGVISTVPEVVPQVVDSIKKSQTK